MQYFFRESSSKMLKFHTVTALKNTSKINNHLYYFLISCVIKVYLNESKNSIIYASQISKKI